MPSMNAVLFISFLLFSVGVAGVLIRRNALIILMCVELMLNAANLNLVAFARHSGTVAGQAFALMAKYGGKDVVGDVTDLADGTFWKGYHK